MATTDRLLHSPFLVLPTWLPFAAVDIGRSVVIVGRKESRDRGVSHDVTQREVV
jgi:hypothetical protein